MNPPKLTAEQTGTIAALREMKDEDIDYSDIPPSSSGCDVDPSAAD